MTSVDEHFKNVLSFVDDNRSLVDCHLVDFITEDLWIKCLPDSLREELESIELPDFIKKGNHQYFQKLIATSSELDSFIKIANSLSLKNNRFVLTLNDTFLPGAKDTEIIRSQSFMSNKKQHEIAYLAKLIGFLAVKNEAKLIIDAGAGKGYLSERISDEFGLTVLAIDSSKLNCNSARNRQEILQKKKQHKTALVQYSTRYIDENTDYKDLVHLNFPDGNRIENCILTGLHTCGQLAHSMIKNFLKTDCLKILCVVPCCYHLTEESLTGKCNLSKNARMIAQQSVERSQLKEDEPHPPSLFYRALLQTILISLGIADSRIGRGAPTGDFAIYAHWALTKIGVDSKNMPSHEYLTDLYQNYSHHQWKFNVFQSIRVHLGAVVEAAIILDRVIYLENSSQVSRVTLTQLFDPVISPRCYAIVAAK